MHSLKSTAIAVVLLAVSIGLYQVSSTEDTTSGTDLTSQLEQQLPQGSTYQPHPNNQFQHQLGSAQLPPMGQAPGQPVQRPFGGTYQQPVGTNDGSHNSNTMFASSQTAAIRNSAPIQAPRLTQPTQPLAAPQLQQPNFNNQPVHTPPQLTVSAPASAPISAPALSAPSFDDLRNKFEQSGAADTIQSTGNQITNSLATNLQSAGTSLQQSINGQFNEAKQAMPDLSQAKSAVVQAIDQTRDDGLIDALNSQFNSDNVTSPALASASEPQPISLEAPNTSSFEGSATKEEPAPVSAPADSNDFIGDLQPALDKMKADSEFSATPIGSVNDSVNTLASGHRSEVPDLNVQQANVVPDSLSPQAPSMNLEAAWPEVDRLVADKKFRAALGLLTRYYRQPNLSDEQSKRLHEWLDALAGKVIYSSENHFQETPYTIRSGETLNQIAGRWNVPAQVVYNINRQKIGDSATIVAGTELKVINGPFHAEVDLSSKTLTLFLKNLYAGRFPIRAGISGDIRTGQFRVVAKSAQGHTWRDSDGNDFPPESSENGYGPYWIGLTGSLCLHAIDAGTPEGHAGCIGLKEKDARDVFGILINGAELKIVK